MAMIKCEFCKNMVSDSESKCPHCGHSVSNKVACPKCNSKNTELNIKINGAVKTTFLYTLFGVFLGGAMDKEKIRYTCKDCGKTFKLKEKKKKKK